MDQQGACEPEVYQGSPYSSLEKAVIPVSLLALAVLFDEVRTGERLAVAEQPTAPALNLLGSVVFAEVTAAAEAFAPCSRLHTDQPCCKDQLESLQGYSSSVEAKTADAVMMICDAKVTTGE